MQPNRDLPICVIIQMMDGREPILTDRTGSVCLGRTCWRRRKEREQAEQEAKEKELSEAVG